MNEIRLLDCTLRDGGYCNKWQFGFEQTKSITLGLVEAGIDIIECGFITNKVQYQPDVTKYNTLEQIANVIPKKREGKIFVAMMNYGEYNIDDLPEYDASSIDGIRVAFHKKNINEALVICEQIKAKGYKVFVQAMVSLCYTDEEFLTLIRQVNKIEPYAFYIVDSFGVMKSKDLIRLFYTVENNLKETIWIGFHSHNNMQLAYSNAQTLVGVHTNRNLIIDSSIYGMGRGAGNLNTELFIEYLNENYYKNYQLKPLLTIIDDILDGFLRKNYWGYSLPNYISAKHNAHPNYAGFLDEKKTLTVEDMENIFLLMDEEKKFSYDKNYIEALYTKYLAIGRVQEDHKEELETTLNGKKVLLIAPGKSSIDEKDIIFAEMQKTDVVSISVNFYYEGADYIFLSNLRRYRELDDSKYRKCIVTSNIPNNNVYFQTKYRELLNDVEMVRDNAGLMAIKFLKKYRIKEIMLAGFDGYSHDAKENYADSGLEFINRNAVLDAMNVGMIQVLSKYAKEIKMSFITTPKHITI